MTTTKAAVVLLSLFVALATAKPAADTSLGLLSAVEQETRDASKALAGLSAACTLGSAKSIQEAKAKMFGDIASCSVSSIIKDIAYIMIDSADFGSTVWADGVEIVTAVKACLNETSLLEKVECLDDALSNSSSAASSINNAVRELFEQLIVIIPDIEKEVKACKEKSTQEYILFLDSLVKQAKTC